MRWRRRPALSVVVVVYDMTVQAMNTIESLSPGYQQGADPTDYEVVVVENESASMLDPAAVEAVAPNVRYLRRKDAGKSPAPAVNAGVAGSRGSIVAIVVDGARMMTPGVVANTLRARKLAPSPIVSVPGYHLGDKVHQESVLEGYTAEQEQAALERLDWRGDGYRLFDMAVFSASCRHGYLIPLAESNCIAVPRTLFDELGGFDEGFTTMGGGFVNLDFYRRCVDRGTLVLLPGEGTFHQFHGGATTGAPGVDRDTLLEDMHAEYDRLRGGIHTRPQQAPMLLGRVPAQAMPFLQHSVEGWMESHRP